MDSSGSVEPISGVEERRAVVWVDPVSRLKTSVGRAWSSFEQEYGSSGGRGLCL
jgi:hypothetical protein